MQVISTANLIVVQEVRSADAAQTLLVELQKWVWKDTVCLVELQAIDCGGLYCLPEYLVLTGWK